ncbi:MAG: hypothetical protein HY308_09385 [Gammaproteobacteria bacterium]|nr:hypothetical protein [Gammaproteobacteria bacterium]
MHARIVGTTHLFVIGSLSFFLTSCGDNRVELCDKLVRNIALLQVEAHSKFGTSREQIAYDVDRYIRSAQFPDLVNECINDKSSSKGELVCGIEAKSLPEFDQCGRKFRQHRK